MEASELDLAPIGDKIRTPRAKDCVQELNVVYILRVFIKFLIERVKPRELASFFDDSMLDPFASSPPKITPSETERGSSVTVVVVSEGTTPQVEEIKQTPKDSLIVTVKPSGESSFDYFCVAEFFNNQRICLSGPHLSTHFNGFLHRCTHHVKFSHQPCEIISNACFSNRFDTYDLHREVCTLLLVLFSTQMYRELPLGPDSIVPEDQQQPQQHQQHTNEEGKGKEKEKEEEEPGTGREKEARKDTQSTTTTTTTAPQLRQPQHNQAEENLFADIAQQYHRIPQFMNKLLHNFVEQREKPPRMDPASLFKTIGTAASMSRSLPIFSLTQCPLTLTLILTLTVSHTSPPTTSIDNISLNSSITRIAAQCIFVFLR